MSLSRKIAFAATSLVILAAVPAVAGDAENGEKLFKLSLIHI